MTKTSLILVLGLVLSLSLLSAMEHTVGLRLGASYPFTDVTEDENNLNFMGGLSYEAWLMNDLSLGLSPYYTKLSGKEGLIDYKSTLIGGDLNLKFRPTTPQLSLNYAEGFLKRISPFANLSLGVVNHDTKGTGVTADDGLVFAAPTLGLGVSMLARNNFNIDLGVQWTHAFNDMLDGTEDSGNDSYLTPYLGFGYTFGKKSGDDNLVQNSFSWNRRFTYNNVQFELNSSNLTDEAKVSLDEVAQALNTRNNVRLEVSGHTDNTGTDAINNPLSLARANSVKDYLVSKGIAAERLTTRGFGSTMPIADNTTADGRALNRRIEFMVIR